MTTTVDTHRPSRPRLPHAIERAGRAGVALLCAVLVAYLVGSGYPHLALAMLLALPLANFVLRHPLSVIALWLIVVPFLVAADAGPIRLVYWLVHRALPVVAVINLLLAARFMRRPLPRLGWPELMMFAYLALTQMSILYLSDDVMATTYHLYDRVFIPMCLYLIVRFAGADHRDLQRLIPIVVFIILSQTVFGILQWVAPHLLPSAWLGRLGTRTIGSLSHPNVYGTTMLLLGLLVLHVGMNHAARNRGRRLLWLFPVTLLMVFMTYSRASWLAGLVVALGLFAVYPRYITKLAVVVILASTALVASGRIDEQVQLARNRFLSEQSEESALSRLPVMVASMYMFADRPVVGWGYGNFDRYDQQFQQPVGNLVVPAKDHASHNLYLTLLAEQGIPGFLCYVGPALWWLARTRTAWRMMPAGGLVSRNLLTCLWLALAAHVVVNNYSNMRVVFGLGLWWAVLGLVASLVTRYQPEATAATAARTMMAPAGASPPSPTIADTTDRPE